MALASIINQQAHGSFTICTTYLAILFPFPFSYNIQFYSLLIILVAFPYSQFRKYSGGLIMKTKTKQKLMQNYMMTL